MFNAIKEFRAKLPPLPTPPPSHDLEKKILQQLSVVIGIAVVVHFTIANIAIASFAAFVFLLKCVAIWNNKKSPNTIIMAGLLILSTALVIIFYGGWNGQKAGVSFITLLVALKFLESKNLRDYYVVCLLLYFLAASSFLFNSSIGNIILVIVYTVAVTSLLFRITTPNGLPLKSSLKEAGKIMVKALPLALFLFFFFPRIQGSFGLIESQDKTNGNALKDSLVAGEMASSAFNNALAFRVQFDGEVPRNDQLYWRSKVMPIERNFQWEVLNVDKRDFASGQRKTNSLDLNKGQFRYEILHEKSRDKFIPYLDYVAGISRGRILDDYSVFDKAPKTSAFTYSGSSSLTPSLPASLKLNETQLLNTQSVPTARLQALISSWRSKTNSQNEFVKRAYDYFSNNPFNYSLAPPLLDEETPLDDFIFNSKTGYCEHYASAFTTLMRWSGIPARVVVGYQGGKLNEAGNYLEVRYSDAHAWSEVWLNDQWQRVDPTAAISPDRIEFGMDALIELWDGNSFSNATGQALSNILNPTGGARFFRQISDSWNNVSYQWNKWVVNYDKRKQQDLLKNLGLNGRDTLLTLIGIITIGVSGFMLFYFWQLIPKPVALDEMQKTYRRFTNKFIKHGIDRLYGDTPEDFGNKASAEFPQSKDSIDEVIDAYQLLRYGPPSSNKASQLKQFKQLVKQFKIDTSKA